MSQSAPERFGKYELLKRLAFGGMAEIFLARLIGERGFSKKLVVKRILPQFGEDAQFVRMFIDEAVLAAHINHPNVVQVYDFGSTNNVYFIAMEFVDGADLKQVLREVTKKGGVLEPAQVAAIGEGVAAGLASAHAATDPDGVPLKLVHRDVSPHNVMIGRSGDVKVMDFGIARAEVRATKTATGTIKGKVAYMAPEHGAGERADGRSDQFSLGAVLWECLAGERLYGGDSELEVLRNVLDCRVRDIRELNPKVPESLADLVMRMLETDPNDRFDSLLEVRDALSRFRFTLGPEGAVDLGKLVESIEPPSPVRSSGTLVLEDEVDVNAPTASQLDEVSGAPEGISASAQTEPLDIVGVASGVTATVPAHQEATAPMVSHRNPGEARPSKWWALALLSLVLGALAWITYSGRSRMETQQSPVPAMVTQAALQITSTPAGATVWLDGKSTERQTPMTLDGRSPGQSLQLKLVLAGYKGWEEQVQVKGDGQIVAAELVAEELGPSAAVENHTKTIAPKTRKPPKPKRAKAFKKKSVKVAKEPGRLFLRSSGLWFHVYLDGKRIGTTPLAGTVVPAGKHILTLKNDVAGEQRQISVEVGPGAVIRRTISQ